MSNITIRVRGIVIHNGQLLMCRLNNTDAYYHCLPGGKLELGETIEDGLRREIVEETGIRPELGALLFINQYILPENHNIEFFFGVKNGGDFVGADFTKATHAHEIANLVFGDPTDPKFNLLPHFLANRVPEVIAQGDDFKAEIAISS